MKLKHIIILPLLLMATSCLSLAIKATGLDKKDATVVAFTNNDRTVAFVPMKHVGPKEFYEDVKHIIDSLHAEGYVAYLEGTRIKDSLSKEDYNIVMRKMRKMMGVPITKMGYLDTINGRLMGKKFKNKLKLINQPSYNKLGIDSLIDRIVDIPTNHIVKAYESKYSLMLNDCDYVLPMEDKYECGKEPWKQVSEFIFKYREAHVANTIINDSNQKIAVVYGLAHKDGLLRELKLIDTTWTYKR